VRFGAREAFGPQRGGVERRRRAVDDDLRDERTERRRVHRAVP
jgi:hypothetical protein